VGLWRIPDAGVCITAGYAYSLPSFTSTTDGQPVTDGATVPELEESQPDTSASIEIHMNTAEEQRMAVHASLRTVTQKNDRLVKAAQRGRGDRRLAVPDRRCPD
jgi:tRNA(Met) C34 N-acetyltransferase TmcA